MTNMCMMKLAMMACEQTEGLTIMEHGESVAEWYKDIRNYIRGGELKREWRLPEWINDPIIEEHLLPDDIMETYQIYHDCGKPFCIEWDEEGKRHFPDHARISEETWLGAGGDP